MRILVLTCSPNDPSNSERLAEEFLAGARDTCECDVEKIRLIDFELPQFTLDCYDEHCTLPEGYVTLKQSVEKADGVLIATPVWNFGVPAHLKNFQDWMGCFALDAETRSKGQLGGKPFFYIFTGGAPKAAWKGLMRFTTMFVREGIRYFGGTVTGAFYEGHCTPGKGTFGLVVDNRSKTLKTIHSKGAWFARYVMRFMETGKLPLRQRLFDTVYRYAQRVVAKF